MKQKLRVNWQRHAAVPIPIKTTGSPSAPYDSIGAIIAYEEGHLDQPSTLKLFQHLVETGLVWKLQPHYARTATALIQAGHISARQS